MGHVHGKERVLKTNPHPRCPSQSAQQSLQVRIPGTATTLLGQHAPQEGYDLLQLWEVSDPRKIKCHYLVPHVRKSFPSRQVRGWVLMKSLAVILKAYTELRPGKVNTAGLAPRQGRGNWVKGHLMVQCRM